MAATESAHAHLDGASLLAALGAQALAAAALAGGHAAGDGAGGPLALDRIGSDAATVLIASFGVPHVTSAESAGAPTAPRERRYPLRFVWKMDEDGRFTLDSDEFIALIGPRAAAIGRPWQEMAAELGIDPEGQVARAVATRDTWSGLSVSWPLDAGAERLVVELSGLPVFDRDRMFRGYRGFGVCRDVARLATEMERRRPPWPPRKPQQPSPRGRARRPPAGALARGAENVVPFRQRRRRAEHAPWDGAAVPPRVAQAHATAGGRQRGDAGRRGRREPDRRSRTGRGVPPNSREQRGRACTRGRRPGLRSEQAEPRPDRAGRAGTILDTATDGVVCSIATASSCPPTAAPRRCSATSAHEIDRPRFSICSRPKATAPRTISRRLLGDGVASVLNDGREVIGRDRRAV